MTETELIEALESAVHRELHEHFRRLEEFAELPVFFATDPYGEWSDDE